MLAGQLLELAGVARAIGAKQNLVFKRTWVQGEGYRTVRNSSRRECAGRETTRLHRCNATPVDKHENAEVFRLTQQNRARLPTDTLKLWSFLSRPDLEVGSRLSEGEATGVDR